MILFTPLLILDLPPDKGQEILPVLPEVLVGEYVLGGIFAGFMEAVHVELPNEGVNIAMPEERGQYFLFEGLDVPDRELLARGQPLYNVLEGRLLNGRRVTSRIS